MSSALDTMTDKMLGQAVRNASFASMLRGADGSGVGSGRGPWDPGQDIRAIVNHCCPGGKMDKDALIRGLSEYCETVERAYAGTVGVLTAELDGKPNNAVTLTGNNGALGATYGGGTPVPLFLRINMALAATPGVMLQPWLQIQRITTSPLDAAAGWKLAGGSVVCQIDPVPSFPNDVSFDIMRPEIARLDSPMAQLYNRPVVVPAVLNMSAIHYNTSPIPLIQGVTIEFQDSKCPDYFANSGIWGPQGGRIPFPNVVERMIELVRAHGPEAGREIRKMTSSRWA